MCNRGKDGERGEGGSLPGGRVVYLEVEECEVEEFVSQGEGRKLSVLFMQASGAGIGVERGGEVVLTWEEGSVNLEWTGGIISSSVIVKYVIMTLFTSCRRSTMTSRSSAIELSTSTSPSLRELRRTRAKTWLHLPRALPAGNDIRHPPRLTLYTDIKFDI